MLTLAWDVDDVLNNLMQVWLEEAWLPAHPQCKVTYRDLTSNPPHAEIGASLDEYLASLDRFRSSRYLADLTPSEEATAWFEQNGGRYRHIALTAVPLEFAPISAAWTLRHFGRWIRGFHFVPSYRAGESIPSYDATKGDFLTRAGDVAALIDDHPGNVEAAAALGIRAVLMPRPWNGSSDTVTNVFSELERL
jgi:hypothetical protein